MPERCGALSTNPDQDPHTHQQAEVAKGPPGDDLPPELLGGKESQTSAAQLKEELLAAQLQDELQAAQFLDQLKAAQFLDELKAAQLLDERRRSNVDLEGSWST